MIIILEGVDKVGKSTLCEKLQKLLGFEVWHDEYVPKYYTNYLSGNAWVDRSVNEVIKMKFEILLQIIKEKNIIIDRFHLSEFVYDYMRGLKWEDVDYVEARLLEMETFLILVESENIESSSLNHGSDLKRHEELIKSLYEKSRLVKMKTSFSFLDETVITVAMEYLKCVYKKKKNKHDVYLASPFFNPEQIERRDFVYNELIKKGYSVYSPQLECEVKTSDSLLQKINAFQGNCKAIEESKFVVAITNGKDMGTIWECGYAYKSRIPIFYFAEDLVGPFNLMLAQSGWNVYTTRENFKNAKSLEINLYTKEIE